MPPGVAHLADAPGAAALHGGNGGDRPHPDQAALGISFDLHGKQQHLQQDHSEQEEQRAVTRGKNDHGN